MQTEKFFKLLIQENRFYVLDLFLQSYWKWSKLWNQGWYWNLIFWYFLNSCLSPPYNSHYRWITHLHIYKSFSAHTADLSPSLCVLLPEADQNLRFSIHSTQSCYRKIKMKQVNASLWPFIWLRKNLRNSKLWRNRAWGMSTWHANSWYVVSAI